MTYFILSGFPFMMGFFCLFNGRTTVLGIIGLVGCWLITAMDIYLGIKEVRGKSDTKTKK